MHSRVPEIADTVLSSQRMEAAAVACRLSLPDRRRNNHPHDTPSCTLVRSEHGARCIRAIVPDRTKHASTTPHPPSSRLRLRTIASAPPASSRCCLTAASPPPRRSPPRRRATCDGGVQLAGRTLDAPPSTNEGRRRSWACSVDAFPAARAVRAAQGMLVCEARRAGPCAARCWSLSFRWLVNGSGERAERG